MSQTILQKVDSYLSKQPHEGANHVIDAVGIYRGPRITVIPPTGMRITFAGLSESIQMRDNNNKRLIGLAVHAGIEGETFRLLNYQGMLELILRYKNSPNINAQTERVARWTFYHTFN